MRHTKHDTLQHLSCKPRENGNLSIETTTELTAGGTVSISGKAYTVADIKTITNGRTVGGKMLAVYQATCHLHKEKKKSEQTKQS